MIYTINLFGYSIECEFTFPEGKLQISINDEDLAYLKAYLVRVLVKYGCETSKRDKLEDLIKYAIEIEKDMNGHLNEPKIKLPYEFLPEVKETLIEAAQLQNMSATQLLIRLIEKKYNSVCKEDN